LHGDPSSGTLCVRSQFDGFGPGLLKVEDGEPIGLITIIGRWLLRKRRGGNYSIERAVGL
jgi:hypothetical protein